MKKLLLCLAIILCMLQPTVSLAHPGRTDANGGHRDNNTNTYHYHVPAGSLIVIPPKSGESKPTFITQPEGKRVTINSNGDYYLIDMDDTLPLEISASDTAPTPTIKDKIFNFLDIYTDWLFIIAALIIWWFTRNIKIKNYYIRER